MNQSEIYSVARAAGLSDARAKVAAAIAMAESGGNPQSHNATPPDDSYGLWQINMLGSLGPSRRALYGLKANTDLYDPATNARVMSAISAQGANFKPWTTYTSGRYKQFLAADVSVVDTLGVGVKTIVDGAADAVIPPGVVDTVVKFGDGLTRTARWVSNQQNWVRIAYVIGGGALVLGSISIIARPAVERAAGTAAKLIPAGKVAGVAKSLKGTG